MSLSDDPFYQSRAYVILALFLVLGCLACEGLGIYLAVKKMEIRKWPTTTGTIISSTITKELSGSYKPSVRYEYQSNGVTRYSTKIEPGADRMADTKRPNAERTLAKYPVGKQVDVFVNPKDPSESFLNATFGLVNVLLLTTPLIFSWVFAHSALSSRRRTQHPDS